MSSERINFSTGQTLLIEQKDKASSSLKVYSYKQKLKYMEEKSISQKPIKEVLKDLIENNQYISKKAKESISKVFYFPDDRLIVPVTTQGQDFINHRNKLIQNYGWFFFVIDSEDKLEKKKSKGPSGEKLISTEEYSFHEKTIELKHKKHMRPLYKTKEYYHYNKLMRNKRIPQKPVKKVIHDFFFNYDKVPLKEKKAIRKIIYYEKPRVIVVKSLIGDQMYENLTELVEKFGWYFYITGVPVGESEISNVVDAIEKRFDESYFSKIDLTNDSQDISDIKLTLFPVALKPNHNSMILGIGNFNIMLDCGINEEFYEDIVYYLENYDKLMEHDVDSRKIFTKEELEEKRLNEIDKYRRFEKKQIELDPPKNEVHEGGSMKEEEQAEEETESEYFHYPFEKLDHKIDAIFVSHSHFDHISGLKDLVKLFPDIPILCSRITLDLFLLRDSNFLKQESKDKLENEDYYNVVRNVIFVENGSKLEFKNPDCYMSFFHAGHMPGALMQLVKIRDFRFLFTGDYTYWDITPFAGTMRFLDQISRPIDFLLIDGSNAYDDFGNPSQQFHSLFLFLEHKAEHEDNVLIGADPSSLAITFMLRFWRYFRKKQLKKGYSKRPNIYVDMMVRKNIQVINHRYEYIYGPISRLIRDKANPFNSIKFRWFDYEDLDFLRKRNNIIISHPPDLSYGIIRNIINAIGRYKHNLVYLAGSIHEEPGESLINGADVIEFNEDWKVPFRAMLVNTFIPDLKIKLHGDKPQLMEMLKALDPKEVCFFHQSPRRLIQIAEDVRQIEGIEKVSVPPKRKLMILNSNKDNA